MEEEEQLQQTKRKIEGRMLITSSVPKTQTAAASGLFYFIYCV